MAFSFFSCSGQSKKVKSNTFNALLKTMLTHNVNELSVNQADSLASQNEKALFIDARELEEYNVSHIKNAIWVGYNKLDLTQLNDVDKETPLIIYCSIGARSEKVAQKLIKKGYENAHNLYGGIFEWVNQDKPVYQKTEKTKKVHAYSKTWGIWLNKGEKVYNE